MGPMGIPIQQLQLAAKVIATLFVLLPITFSDLIRMGVAAIGQKIVFTYFITDYKVLFYKNAKVNS